MLPSMVALAVRATSGCQSPSLLAGILSHQPSTATNATRTTTGARHSGRSRTSEPPATSTSAPASSPASQRCGGPSIQIAAALHATTGDSAMQASTRPNRFSFIVPAC